MSASEEVSVVVTILPKTDRKPTLGGKCLEEWQQWPFTGLGGESQAAGARPPGFFPCPKGRRLKAVLDKSDVLHRRTKQHIIGFLKHKLSSGTPVEISEAMNKAGHNLNRKQVQKQLSRMKAETARLRSTSMGTTALWEDDPGSC